jgi:glycine/D-amino acid oxidase-like deaminating enzyme
MSPRERSNELSTDVLVVGGGLAGGWAATAAARAGASVILVDKGYFGTSGVTATAGPGALVGPTRSRAAEGGHRGTLGASVRLGRPRLDGTHPGDHLANTAHLESVLRLSEGSQRHGP